jgi:single-stranded-DNA-specific exonuclease
MRLLRVEPAPIAYIPHRVTEGYGLHAEALDELKGRGIEAVITVDCGGSSIAEAQRARELGLELAITDHHRLRRDESGEPLLPVCAAIAHPELGGTPFRAICAAMVALKIAKRLIRLRHGERPPPLMVQWIVNEALPLAAVGTVADVMPLLDENRVVVGNGLAALRHTAVQGLRTLIPAAALKGDAMDSSVIGFQIAPRLNSAGRLEHAAQALDLLLSESEAECRAMAGALNELNQQRKLDTEAIHVAARAMVVARGLDAADSHAIALADAAWNPGILGPAASRLCEEFARPVMLLGASDSGWKGSGRAPAGFDLHACLTRCAAHFTSFGGHAAAAGGTIAPERLDAFVADFELAAAEQMRGGVRRPELRIDADMPLAEATGHREKYQRTLAQIRALGPFGQGFAEPNILFRDLGVYRTDILAGTALKLTVRDASGAQGELILWRGAHLRELFKPPVRFDAVGCPKPASNPRFPPSIHVKDVRFHDRGG